ncbi:MAG: hypothetical protein CSA22_00590 [Deltaproteobacteria bacterium]|nr:MAG: hypothetical protein CSA22_00590 [Deltaproteobacteria bacterium]
MKRECGGNVRNRWHGRLLVTCFCWVIFGLLTAGCRTEAPDTVEEQIRPVRYTVVTAQNGTVSRAFPGVARAGVASRLSFRVPGTVVGLTVNVGDRVKEGQEIARIDAVDYELKVEQAEAALVQAQAQERNAAANYRRVRGLYENRNASRNDLDAARAAAESSLAAVNATEKQLALARRQLAYTRLTAPADCMVADVPVEVNEHVMPGSPVVLVHCGSAIEVGVTVPGALIRKIKQGGTAVVAFDAISGRSFTGSVTEVGVSTTGMQTTFPVTVRLTEAERLIRPGMAAEVTFKLMGDTGSQGVFIPPVAVVEDRSGRFVYVVIPAPDGLGKTLRRPVTIGAIGAAGIQVLSGLSAGDRVVIAGVSRIHDNQVVRLLPDRGEDS